jgi:hypothetical protein
VPTSLAVSPSVVLQLEALSRTTIKMTNTTTTQQLMAVVLLPVTSAVVVVLPQVGPHQHLQTLVAPHLLTLPTQPSLLHSASLPEANHPVLNRPILRINNRQTLRSLWVHLLLLSNNTNRFLRLLLSSIPRVPIIPFSSSNNTISLNNTITCTLI